jgi:cytidine deaminase
MSEIELAAEDTKLITMARQARARIGALEGAAVRDGDGRTYTGVTISQPSFGIGALQFAVAAAVAAGARTLEAAAVVTEASALEPAGSAAVRDLAPTAPIHLANPAGQAFATR